eukprot:761300-Hanusia_phi.AAC.1
MSVTRLSGDGEQFHSTQDKTTDSYRHIAAKQQERKSCYLELRKILHAVKGSLQVRRSSLKDTPVAMTGRSADLVKGLQSGRTKRTNKGEASDGMAALVAHTRSSCTVLVQRGLMVPNLLRESPPRVGRQQRQA